MENQGPRTIDIGDFRCIPYLLAQTSNRSHQLRLQPLGLTASLPAGRRLTRGPFLRGVLRADSRQ